MTSCIDIHANLRYRLDGPTSFAFAVAAAETPHQRVVDESITLDPALPHSIEAYGEDRTHRLLRLDASSGPVTLDYRATVALSPRRDDPARLSERPFGDIPAEVLPYLNPSRYCESDRLTTTAERLVGPGAPGYERVRAVNDWVGSALTYLPGSTDASSGTLDVLVQRAGVCRDFAHVAISLCRALGVPARYVAGYGIGVDPQDFHGFFEAWLGDDWWLFDPTGMTKPEELVRIAYGRDAADASFATFAGPAVLEAKTVEVTGHGRQPDEATAHGIVGGDDGPTSTA